MSESTDVARRDEAWRIVLLEGGAGRLDVDLSVLADLPVEISRVRCEHDRDAVDALHGVDIAVAGSGVPFDESAMRGMRRPATIVAYGVGFDSIDIEAARRLGVTVATLPSYGVETVADHAVALLLSLLRRVPALDAAIRARGWVSAEEAGPIRGFSDTTVGLVGTGRIGRAVADRLRAFGFTIIAVDPYADAGALRDAGIEPVPWPDLLARSHALSLHSPLTAETRHLVGRAAFAALQPGALLVNTSRGGLVDESALVEALSTGRIAAAGLDVFEHEPLPASSPLRSFPDRVLLTPHAAFFSARSMDNLREMSASQIRRAVLGEPLEGVVT